MTSTSGTCKLMRKLVAALGYIHAPPAWFWFFAIVALTAAVWYYSEVNAV